jgi:hypothetical protein
MKTNYVKGLDITAYLLMFILIPSTLICGYLLFNTFWGDSTIYIIYAKNIASGNFFSFNPGEFSSGATSPLWALILSTGFILGNGIIFAKVIGIIFTLLALITTYKVSAVITKSKIGSAIGTGFLFDFLILSGLFFYESSLIVCLISISILLTFYIIQKQNNRYLWILGAIWSLIPLVRPEAIFIVFLNLFVLIFKYRKNREFSFKILFIFFLSLLPSILYFGYSYFKLGLLSSSTFCRIFMSQYTANYFQDLYFWPITLIFSELTVLMGLFIGTFGILKSMKDNSFKWLIFFGLVCISIFILIFTIYSPPLHMIDAKRYVLPIIPFIVIFISIGISKILSTYKFSFSIILISLITLTLVVSPAVGYITSSMDLKNSELNFDTITEKNAIEYINSIAEPNATILAFEVQDRFYLRPDLKILSMDGITDGKIAPYLSNHDINGFLWKYKPKYWIANEATSLPFFSDSMLSEVVEKTGHEEGNEITINGITFKNIKPRKEPVNTEFWGYTQIYELSYN